MNRVLTRCRSSVLHINFNIRRRRFFQYSQQVVDVIVVCHI